MRKVLVANRGEIAVRVVRACRDAGLDSVAVYAESDLDALHVSMAGEAYALGGPTPAESYLAVEKILAVAAESGADAVHPGYGFLAENAGFAQAVLDAGLIWIGPPPAAIEALGDKVAARRIAAAVGAPMAAGTDGPVSGVEEVDAFVSRHGLPIAIKAAFGGGGRGLKVVRSPAEIGEAYESAVREAVAAFGRGECFVERYLDRPRHVETQCLADAHGNVAVISTRDCSLQRRHQKLVEEAPAPFLSPSQVEQLYQASKAILREAGYVGAGTCEFLVGQDGTVSFLEVNTRLQVEHPVSEEVTGIDLVREMFRIADGQELGYADPPPRGHSIEFRVNAEDPGRNFLPAPGTITELTWPSGPGVRVDAGYAQGMTVPQAFDSLLAKLIITGASRTEALRAGPPRAGRVRGRRDADGAPLPPRGGPGPGVHRRAVPRAHPVDRDRVRRGDRALVRVGSAAAGRRGERPGRAGPARADHRGGERQAARGGAPGRARARGCAAGRPRGRGGRTAAVPGPAGRRRRRPRPAATTSRARCRAPSPRSLRPRGIRCRRVTPWWCSRR